MMMRGKEVSSLWELAANFAIDDLINVYYTGELEFFLRKCGEDNKANALGDIPQNAYLLVRLYKILDIEPDLTEDQIRRYHV